MYFCLYFIFCTSICIRSPLHGLDPLAAVARFPIFLVEKEPLCSAVGTTSLAANLYFLGGERLPCQTTSDLLKLFRQGTLASWSSSLLSSLLWSSWPSYWSSSILVIQLYHKLIKMQLQNLSQNSASNFDQSTAINGAYQHCPRNTID